MSEPEQQNLIAPPTEQQIADAHASFLLDIFNRILAGRNLIVIMTVIGSLLYNIAKDINPKARSFIAENLVKITNDILALKDESANDSQTTETKTH